MSEKRDQKEYACGKLYSCSWSFFSFSEKELYYTLPFLLYFFLYFPTPLLGLVFHFLYILWMWLLPGLRSFQWLYGCSVSGFCPFSLEQRLKGSTYLWNLCLGMKRHSLEQSHSQSTAFVWKKSTYCCKPTESLRITCTTKLHSKN